MLAYVERRQRIGERSSSPSTMLLIIGAHIAAVAIAMSVKMAVDQAQGVPPPKVFWVPTITPPPPPEVPPAQDHRPQPSLSTVDRPVAIVPTKPADQGLDARPMPFPPLGDLAGHDPVKPEPVPQPRAVPEPVRTGPRLATSGDALRPPYPASRLESQQEASLKLRLSIDDRGRVVSVEPVGPVDRAFLDSARRHLLARWRYEPATVDGRPTASTTVITLRFQLED